MTKFRFTSHNPQPATRNPQPSQPTLWRRGGGIVHNAQWMIHESFWTRKNRNILISLLRTYLILELKPELPIPCDTISWWHRCRNKSSLLLVTFWWKYTAFSDGNLPLLVPTRRKILRLYKRKIRFILITEVFSCRNQKVRSEEPKISASITQIPPLLILRIRYLLVLKHSILPLKVMKYTCYEVSS